jgi:hypothetical protein
VVTAALLVAGTLMTVGYAYTNCSVHHELAAQQISFPAAGNPALASPDIGPFLNKYAGQQLVNGAQARACADHFIAVHVKAAAGGQTYAQLSTKAQANPTDASLKAQVDTLFKGETLRACSSTLPPSGSSANSPCWEASSVSPCALRQVS